MSQTDYINLIHKQLSGEITQEELSQLNEWLNASAENKAEAEAISLIWENSDFDPTTLPELDQVDVDAEFALLDARIKSDQTSQEETKVIPMRRRTWTVAASIAVVLGLGATFFFFNGFNSPEMAEVNTGDEAKEILLADGSTVHLNENSSLKYPVEFTGETREVELTGEGFFEIAKDPSHPFTVHTPYEDVTVLGTSFNVRAYADEPNTEVAVSTGKVQVSSGPANQILLPNEKAVVDHSSGVIGFEHTESLNESAWHTGVIKFSNAPAPEVLDDLEDYYGVSFTYEDAAIANCLFTSTFENEDLSTVLKTISTVLDVTINEGDNGNYVLVGGGCQ